MSSLPDRERQVLLEVARREVRRAALGESASRPPPGNFPVIAFEGLFVTLRRRGRLRGCIGQLSSPDPLPSVVAHCARAAALEDPRFASLGAEEFPEIEIEISLLLPAADVTLQEIETGTHGLIVSSGDRRGVLLPQVALEFHFTAERFLQETCVKAGLDRNAWKDPGTRVQAFTAEVFSCAASERTDMRNVEIARES